MSVNRTIQIDIKPGKYWVLNINKNQITGVAGNKIYMTIDAARLSAIYFIINGNP